MADVVSVVVLCGGTSRRLGGVDKTRQRLGETTVLDLLLDALPTAWVVTCVGDQRPTRRQVRWVREEPAGGGPVAAVAAALSGLTAQTAVVLAGDMPFAGPLATTLPASVGGHDAAVAVTPDGRAQPLLGAYRTAALRQALPADPGGVAMMTLLDRLDWAPVACDPTTALDLDTPADLQHARHIVEP